MKKIIIQSVICFFIAVSFFAAEHTGSITLSSVAAFLRERMNREYSISELSALPETVRETVAAIPFSLSDVQETFGTGVQYGEPIDEKPLTETAMVYAVAGGTVSEVGSNEDIGNYIVISHGNEARSIYGNLSNIKVEEKERVKKGEIIGGYDKNAEKDFYYALNSFD